MDTTHKTPLHTWPWQVYILLFTVTSPEDRNTTQARPNPAFLREVTDERGDRLSLYLPWDQKPLKCGLRLPARLPPTMEENWPLSSIRAGVPLWHIVPAYLLNE